jgi:SAM-dependent methyltransferase
MLESLKKYYENQQFYPGFLGLFINPFYIARKELLKNILASANEINGLTIDIGCGNKPYEKLFKVSNYIGIDLQKSIHDVKSFADIFYDGKTIPVKDNLVDSIICNQVFEHVFEPNLFLSELNRILKLRGKLLITLPFVWDEHEKPYDFARYSSFGIRYLLDKHGFEIIVQKKTSRDLTIFAQMLNLYLYKLVYRKHSLLKKCVTLFLMTPVTFFGIVFGKIMPRNDDLYLDNIILASKRNNLS